MKFVLERLEKTPRYTIGKITEAGKFLCWTMEDAYRPPTQPKIPGQTAIPDGTYRVTITNSPKFGLVPKLHGVKGFTDILIHAGNSPDDTEGCILPGLERGTARVARSAEACRLLSSKIKPALGRGENVEIQVF